ncbi:hypothetical protein HAX54_011879, partial [Datura stramonium]|nr:hypothetical protein [Datura stramonium]
MTGSSVSAMVVVKDFERGEEHMVATPSFILSRPLPLNLGSALESSGVNKRLNHSAYTDSQLQGTVDTCR